MAVKFKQKPLNKNAYAVGYGKPPKHSQFKPGKSGNLKGRPKGAKNLKTELEEELHEKITIKESGKAKNVSKQRAMIKAMMAKAVKGDMKAATTLLNMFLKLVPESGEELEHENLSENDVQILENFKSRLLEGESQ